MPFYDIRAKILDALLRDVLMRHCRRDAWEVPPASAGGIRIAGTSDCDRRLQ
jgi:hypothetical protein